jgi:hypothetical protein
VLAAEELSAGGFAGAGWQVLGGLAICAVAVAAALLGRRDGGAGEAPSSGPAGPDQSMSAGEAGLPEGALTRPAAVGGRTGRATVGGARAGRVAGPIGADERRQFDEIVSRLTADYPSLARPV